MHMSREELRIRRELRLALEQWLLNGYFPVAHIVAEPDLSDNVESMQACCARGETSIAADGPFEIVKANASARARRDSARRPRVLTLGFHSSRRQRSRN
jgi:hypothetical protein